MIGRTRRSSHVSAVSAVLSSFEVAAVDVQHAAQPDRSSRRRRTGTRSGWALARTTGAAAAAAVVGFVLQFELALEHPQALLRLLRASAAVRRRQRRAAAVLRERDARRKRVQRGGRPGQCEVS